MRKQSAFTLIEVVVVILILGIVAAIAAPIISKMSQSTYTQQKLMGNIQQGRNALLRITEDLRNMVAIGSSVSISSGHSSEITFQDAEGDTITYDVSSSNLERNNELLAQGVSSGDLDFYYYNGSGSLTNTKSDIRYVKVSFTMSDSSGTSIPFSSLVYLRNSGES
ncbi:MAG: type II secretion system protein [Gammaproteobacteria bacterium]